MRGKRENGRPTWFVKGYDSAATDQLRQGTQRGNRIGQKLQNEAAHHCIEWFDVRKFAHIRLREAHIMQGRLSHANSGSGYRARIAFYSNHLSCRTHKSAREHSYVPDAGTKVQDTLAWTNTGFTEEPFGERGQKRCLTNQAIVFRVGAAQCVIGGWTTR